MAHQVAPFRSRAVTFVFVVALILGATTSCGLLEGSGQLCRVTEEGIEYRRSNEPTEAAIPWDVEVGEEYRNPWCSPGDEVVAT